VKVISRETIKALRKDVTAKCYGGDISVNVNYWKNKKGEETYETSWKCRDPSEAFMAVLKLND
jgi:GTP-binding protein LepA